MADLLHTKRWRCRGPAIALAIAMLLPAQHANVAQTVGSAAAPAQPALSQRTLSRLLLLGATTAGSRLVAVGEHGYAIYSDDQGGVWRRAPSPRRALLTAVTFVDERHGWAVGHDGLILASSDSGSSWTEQRYAPDDKQPLFAVHFRDAAHGIALGAYGLYLETADGGKTWTRREITAEDKHFYAIAGDGARRLVIAAEAGTLLVSEDQGRTWAQVASPYRGSFFGLVVAADGALLVFGLRGNIFRSHDFGRTWTPANAHGTAALQGGARLGNGEIVLAGSAGTVLSSRDNGASFQRLARQRAITYSTVLPTANGALLLGEAGPVPYVPPAATASRTPVLAAERGAR